jgi:CRISPR-associated protein Csx3
MLPWLAHDALVHYLAPRGLEQFSGGGWGTRDVSQGPVELLLAVGRWDALRDLLVRIFAAQNPDGDWPQWFTFFERDRGSARVIRTATSSSGRSWRSRSTSPGATTAPPRARSVPFFHPDGEERGERATILAHVERALDVVARRTIPGRTSSPTGTATGTTRCSPSIPRCASGSAARGRSPCTRTRSARSRAAVRGVGRGDVAARLDALAARYGPTSSGCSFPDGTLAGFAYFHSPRPARYWVHPRTGRRDALRGLAMTHAILANLLTPASGRATSPHARAPPGADGARLFDRPSEYSRAA